MSADDSHPDSHEPDPQGLPTAPNGEGELGTLDPSWHEGVPVQPARSQIAAMSARIGLPAAIARSLYVSDVFFALQSLPIERYEAFLTAIGAAAEDFAKLRTSYTGTLAGDFVHWCRNGSPGTPAHGLAERLAASGITEAARYNAALRRAVG